MNQLCNPATRFINLLISRGEVVCSLQGQWINWLNRKSKFIVVYRLKQPSKKDCRPDYLCRSPLARIRLVNVWLLPLVAEEGIAVVRSSRSTSARKFVCLSPDSTTPSKVGNNPSKRSISSQELSKHVRNYWNHSNGSYMFTLCSAKKPGGVSGNISRQNLRKKHYFLIANARQVLR